MDEFAAAIVNDDVAQLKVLPAADKELVTRLVDLKSGIFHWIEATLAMTVGRCGQTSR
jgi:hypothetical protein